MTLCCKNSAAVFNFVRGDHQHAQCAMTLFSLRLASVFILFRTKLLCQFQKIPQDDTVNFTYFLPKNKRITCATYTVILADTEFS